MNNSLYPFTLGQRIADEGVEVQTRRHRFLRSDRRRVHLGEQSAGGIEPVRSGLRQARDDALVSRSEVQGRIEGIACCDTLLSFGEAVEEGQGFAFLGQSRERRADRLERFGMAGRLSI